MKSNFSHVMQGAKPSVLHPVSKSIFLFLVTLMSLSYYTAGQPGNAPQAFESSRVHSDNKITLRDS